MLAAVLTLSGPRYPSGPSRAAFFRDLAENARSLPGVAAAGAISDLPVSAGAFGNSRTIFRSTDTDFRSLVLARPVALIRSVTAGYSAAGGTPLLAGRFFAGREPAPVALIGESLAHRLWPGEPTPAVVGRTLRHPQMDATLPIAAIRTLREMVDSSVAERRFQMLLTSLFAVVALLLGAVGVYGVVSYSVACRMRDIGLRMALGAMRGEVMRWVFVRGMRPVVIGMLAGLAR